MFERILVPLDGSKLGELALPGAEEIAAAFGSEVTLLHVCEIKHPEHYHMHQAYTEKIVGQTTSRIRVQRSEQAAAARVKAVILDGDPAAQIIEYAEKYDIRLLIIVSHGRSGIMPWSMGSTATKILQRTTRPVLFIRARKPIPETAAGTLFSRIMIPLDGSPNAEAALPYVKELTNRITSLSTLFRVVVPGYHVQTIGGLNYVRLPKSEIDRLTDEAKQYLEQVIVRVRSGRATVRTEVRTGDPAQEIIKFASESAISLIALSSHGHSSVDKWTFGGVTNKILHGGQTPLFLVRPYL